MKKYESPEILVVALNTKDVITASNDVNNDNNWTDIY